LGFSKFSKFLTEASSRGLVKLKKLDNGQYEVEPAKGGGRSRGADDENGRGRRDRKGRGRRDRRDRDDGRVQPPTGDAPAEPSDKAVAAGGDDTSRAAGRPVAEGYAL